MQGFAQALSRRKNTLLLAAAVGAGGYASYSYYKSDSFQRRKRQAILLLQDVSKVLQALLSAADSAALISADLNSFLRSDDSEVPRSLRQLFKIFHCSQFQDLLAASSSRLCTELFLSRRPPTHRSRSKFVASPIQSSESSDHGWSARRSRTYPPSSSSSSRRSSSLPDRLLNKVFSEAGRGFASAVVGSAVRSMVLSVFQELERKSKSTEESTAETFELGPGGVSKRYHYPVDSQENLSDQLLNLASSGKGKLLIADCIQQFVEAAVSTYLDKTRDVNVFEEIVEAVTMPVHQLPAQEILVNVCNGAVDTFVRTSYRVICSPEDGKGNGNGSDVAKGDLAEKILLAVAAPGNRSLVVDVAGRVSSEAVRSFVTVVQSEMVGVGNREAVTRLLVLLTVFLAAILHFVTR